MGNLCLRVLERLVGALRARSRSCSSIDISDEYVKWLCYVNASPGLQRGNLYCFDYAIRNLPSVAPIVEIGSFCGLSTNLLTYYKEKQGVHNPLVTCDPWEFRAYRENQDSLMIGQSQIRHSEYRKFVKETFVRNILMFSRYDLPYTIERSSDDFFAAWRKSAEVLDVLGRPIHLGGPISFCYVDGDHRYDYVKRDFENCDGFLEKGGFILFDDSADDSYWKEVCRVIQEIKASGKYKIITKNPNYLFKKI